MTGLRNESYYLGNDFTTDECRTLKTIKISLQFELINAQNIYIFFHF